MLQILFFAAVRLFLAKSTVLMPKIISIFMNLFLFIWAFKFNVISNLYILFNLLIRILTLFLVAYEYMG